MGVLYEHWRTDLNECFYVGISWQNPDTRPHELDNRSDDHIELQAQIKSARGSVEVRLVECSQLTRKELCELEKMQIAYWKYLIGYRLVNGTLGGEGIHIDWTEERRQEHAELMQNYGSIISEKKIEWWAVPENKEKTRNSLLAFFQTDYGKELVKLKGITHSERMTAFYRTDEGKETARLIGIGVKENRNFPEWKERNPNFELKIGSTLRAFAQTEEGRKSYERRRPNISAGIELYYKTKKGREQALINSWWCTNVRFQKYWGA